MSTCAAFGLALAAALAPVQPAQALAASAVEAPAGQASASTATTATTVTATASPTPATPPATTTPTPAATATSAPVATGTPTAAASTPTSTATPLSTAAATSTPITTAAAVDLTQVGPLSDQSVQVESKGRKKTVRPLKTVRTSDGREAVAERIVVAFKPGVSEVDRQDVHRKAQHGGANGAQKVSQIGSRVQQVALATGSSLDLALRAYRADPRVAYAEPDFVNKVDAVPNDSAFSNQWGMPQIQAPTAWDITHGSASRSIAILDCGIYESGSTIDGSGHLDLQGKIANRALFVPNPDTDDWCNHGTHVAGIAAAATNNGTGVAGVGYDTRLLNVKVLDDTGVGTETTVANGIYWAADQGASVINLSLGRPGPCGQTMQDAVSYATARNVVVVAAAGNDGVSDPYSPADCNGVLSVGAADQSDARPAWSNYGTWVSVAAPGVDIYSTDNHGGYEFLSGTSMATPHVSGLAALVWSTRWGTSAQAVVDRIKSTADHVAGTGTTWAAGRINAAAAVVSGTLSVDSTSVLTGGSVNATWSEVQFPSPNDWIGIFRAGDGTYLDFIWTSSCSQTASTARAAGTCSITMPGTPGQYELRLYTNETWTLLAKASPITVSAPPVSLTVDSTTVPAGGSVTATWSPVTNPTPNDWIGIFPVGAPNDGYLDFMWTSSCSRTATTARASGSCVVQMPSAGGAYELRLLANQSTRLLATSAAISVSAPAPASLSVDATSVASGGAVTATWTGVSNPTPNDWIGVFPVGAPNDGYLDFVWTSSCTKSASTARAAGSCSISMPSAPGTYELRLLANQSTTRLASTGPVTVSTP